jgi:hypothetical protein
MHPKTYKDQWSAVQNGTYWAAAHFLAKKKHESKSGGKRHKASCIWLTKVVAGASSRADIDLLMTSINAVKLPVNASIYDSCPELVKNVCLVSSEL